MPEREEYPAAGSSVNLRWRHRWITAHVVRHRGGGALDLVADGVPRERLLAVGHGPNGWLLPLEVELDWKQRHANDSETATEHDLVTHAIENVADNLNLIRGGLAWLALFKVANIAAQVARAQALGFDPDLLRLSDEEADDELVRRAAEIVLAGVPVRVLGL